MKGMYTFLEDVPFKCLAGDSWNITKSGFSFLNRLELEISILSWQRSQPLDSDLEFYVRKSLRVQIKNAKLMQ